MKKRNIFGLRNYSLQPPYDPSQSSSSSGSSSGSSNQSSSNKMPPLALFEYDHDALSALTLQGGQLGISALLSNKTLTEIGRKTLMLRNCCNNKMNSYSATVPSNIGALALLGADGPIATIQEKNFLFHQHQQQQQQQQQQMELSNHIRELNNTLMKTSVTMKLTNPNGEKNKRHSQQMSGVANRAFNGDENDFLNEERIKISKSDSDRQKSYLNSSNSTAKNYVSPFDENYLGTFSATKLSEKPPRPYDRQQQNGESTFRPRHQTMMMMSDNCSMSNQQPKQDKVAPRVNQNLTRAKPVDERRAAITKTNYPTWKTAAAAASSTSNVSNDYEALETNTITGSFANLSMVTSFSEIIDDDTNNNNNNNNSTQQQLHQESSKSLCVNNSNELISRSSKITKELEMKLRERRMIMESKSDKFKPKVIHSNELNNINIIESSTSRTSSDLERQLNYWHQSEIIASSSCSTNSKSYEMAKESCVCPCHQHDIKSSAIDEEEAMNENLTIYGEQHEHQHHYHQYSDHQQHQHHHHHHHHSHHENNYDEEFYQPRHVAKEQQQQQPKQMRAKLARSASPAELTNSASDMNLRSKSSSSNTSNVSNSVSCSSPMKPATMPKRVHLRASENSAAESADEQSTPSKATKRESIRMLIENKAVSENKQKDALEMHLSTILCTRTGVYKLSSN